VKLWLAKAEDDLLAGELILKGTMSSYDAVGFHAQQAAEKSLKALLIRHQVEFSKTHNLGELLRLAEPVAPGIAGELADAEALTPYAVDSRYPSEEPPMGREEATRQPGVARKVLTATTSRLRPYLDAGRPGG